MNFQSRKVLFEISCMYCYIDIVIILLYVISVNYLSSFYLKINVLILYEMIHVPIYVSQLIKFDNA